MLDATLRASLSEALYLCAYLPPEQEALRAELVRLLRAALGDGGPVAFVTLVHAPARPVDVRLCTLLAEAALLGALPHEPVDRAMRLLLSNAEAA